MTNPHYDNIVIVGGGMAGLAAAFELTKPGRCPGENVVIYQMGWRLGGKCASGRDDEGRIAEHGLHIWFGYYENAFRLLQEVYGELAQLPGNESANWLSAIEPQRFTPIGTEGGGFVPLNWPDGEGIPGDGSPLSVLGSMIGVLELLGAVHDALTKNQRLTSCEHCISLPGEAPVDALRDDIEPITLRVGLDLGIKWLNLIQEEFHSTFELGNAANYFNTLADEMQTHQHTEADRLLGDLYDLTGAFIAGVITQVIITGIELSELDRFDFREWLVSQGADYASAYRSPFVKALYDTMFQYPDGLASSPSYGAGTAVNVVLRLLGTYKGSAVWKPKGSLGEVLVAPLYRVLQARGVRFEFFHKLTEIELTEDKKSVARLRFVRQVNALGDEYEPTVNSCNCWPLTPKWDLIENGTELRDRKIDLESRWCDQQACELTLEQGVDFSDLVLAIPLGAFKHFSGKRGPCDELIRASPKFRALAGNIPLVPSLSVQLWCTRTLSGLGWTRPSPTMVSGEPALQIWADMSHILFEEAWSTRRPLSLHYFCNVFDSSPRRVDATTDRRQVRKLTIEWLEQNALKLWPLAGNERFDWNILFDRQGRKNEARVEGQILAANVDPCACCASSAAGTTRWRLKAGESGFAYLVLAGAWTDTGLNTECIEAAVMSGMQASRTLCGSPQKVFGEDFLQFGQAAGFGGPWHLLTRALSLVFS
ncbi:oleate hydratase [Bradyrhizobium jicamae]|uniref:oleate hydratase n=1 Tax=Bradyrhizobium jicamae TaxID=280332 RepID=UPI001BAB96EA|nr:oleate hydratase [Bradyrhizobium jicamae]MBR0939160.1 oleate hydratase [Bradyrhizobium jicamae]